MSKPDKPKASEVEKVNAAIALEDKKFYREQYLPKLKEFVNRSFNEEESMMNVAEGRAQADTMQALTSNPNRRAMMAVDAQADLASAASAQALQGTRQGLQAARSDQVTGIKMANQMASQTAAGLSQASRIATTDTLNKIKAKQTRTQGLIKAGETLGVAAGEYYTAKNGPILDNLFSGQSKEEGEPVDGTVNGLT